MGRERTLRVLQAVFFVAGCLCALASVGQATGDGTLLLVEVGLAMFALSFLAAGGAAYVGGNVRVAVLAGVAAILFALLAVGPPSVDNVVVVLLFVVGVLYLLDVLQSAWPLRQFQ